MGGACHSLGLLDFPPSDPASASRAAPLFARACDLGSQGLTVHHRDHNHDNNPPDGSNWENLCVECHADEHSRMGLADYYEQGNRDASASAAKPAERPAKFTGLGTLGEKFGALLKKNRP